MIEAIRVHRLWSWPLESSSGFPQAKISNSVLLDHNNKSIFDQARSQDGWILKPFLELISVYKHAK